MDGRGLCAGRHSKQAPLEYKFIAHRDDICDTVEATVSFTFRSFYQRRNGR